MSHLLYGSMCFQSYIDQEHLQDYLVLMVLTSDGTGRCLISEELCSIGASAKGDFASKLGMITRT